MATVIPWLIACAAFLLHRPPTADAESIATAIARTVEAHGPVFSGPDGARRTAAALLSLAFYESTLRVGVVGKQYDCGAFQHVTRDSDECVRLRSDVDHAADVAHADLLASVRACPAHPLAVYARGAEGCTSAWAQRLSAGRMNMARTLLGVVAKPAVQP